MQTGSREDVKNYNLGLVEEYWAGDSYQTIATRSGRSVSTIIKLVKADIRANGERVRVKKPDDPRIMLNKKILSAKHSWIGLQIGLYRAQNDLTPSSMGMVLNATRVMVRNMEIGSHDFTLTQLERIAEVLSIPFMTLITPAMTPVTRET
jgi:hypothetical protein